MNIEKNISLVFENAQKNGLNADDYMYMCSENGLDYFKNKITRKYVTINRWESNKIKQNNKDKIRSKKWHIEFIMMIDKYMA